MATKKVNVNKLNEIIQNEVSQSLTEIKKAKAKKPAEPKEKEVPKQPEAKVEKDKATPKKDAASKKKEAVTKEVTKINKTQLVEKVVSNREVKYIYPDDVNDTLTRKAWRQKVRNKLDKLERDMYRIKDTNSKEYKFAQKAYNDYRKTVLKEVG